MSYLMVEFACQCGRRLESLELRAAPAKRKRCDCGAWAKRAISAVKSKTVWASAVSMGKSDPTPPLALDWCSNSRSPAEQLAAQRKRRRDKRLHRVMHL